MRRQLVNRRTTLWLATIGYALVASGLPLPLGGTADARPSPAAKRLAGKDHSRPFPCMDKPCGCATAEQCFSSCCCNTPAELLAWAKARRLEPGLIAGLVRRAAAAAPQVESCCRKQRSEGCAEAPAQVTDAAGDATEVRYGISLRALRACQGLAAEWFLLGGSLPPLLVEPIQLVAAPVDGIRLVDDLSFGTPAAPEGPPPRLA